MDELITKMSEYPLRTCTVSLAVASLSYLTFKGLHTSLRGSASYPPGPPRKPLIGALGSFPGDHFSQRFSEWAGKYGDIVYAPIPGTKHVIFNSPDVAQELLGKKPNTTAGRGIGYYVRRLMGWDWWLVFMQPNAHHANQRKMFRKGLGPAKISSHDALIESEMAKLLPVLQNFQGNPLLALQQTVSRILIKITYGERIYAEMGEDLTTWDIEAVKRLTKAIFSFWWVDVFHFLRFIPGLSFKTMARESTQYTRKLRYEPYKRGLELYKSGALDRSLLNDLLYEFGDQDDVRDTLATIFSAGSNMIPSALIAGLQALFLHPEAAQKIYEEIQSVTGGERLPTIADKNSLPYTEAVLKECVRWRTFVPLGIPHVNDNDEIVRGQLIPKGSVIHINLGYIFNNPKVWGDPEVFRPERWLGDEAVGKTNPLTFGFGFGMRVCPGMYLADHMLLYSVAAVFSLYKVVPLEGKKLPDINTLQYEDKMTRHPIGFECRFVPRDQKAQQLINALLDNE